MNHDRPNQNRSSRQAWRIVVGCLIVVVVSILIFRRPTVTVGPQLPPGKVAPQLSSEAGNAAMVAPDGSLWIWGGTRNGMFYEFTPGGSALMSETPVRVGTDTDWQKVSVGIGYALAIKKDGSLWSLTRPPAPHGSLTVKSPALPARLGTDANWADVQYRDGAFIALKQDGTLWTWGRSVAGLLGDDSQLRSRKPAMIAKGQRWQQIQVGVFAAYALNVDGRIAAWGDQGDPQGLVAKFFHGFWPGQAGYWNLRNKAVPDWETGSGQASYWEPYNGGAPASLDAGTNWVAIAGGYTHLLALKADGTLWICGQSAGVVAGNLSLGSTRTLRRIGSDSDWAEIHSAANWFVCRKTDNSWWFCGSTELGDLNRTAPLQRLPFNFDPQAIAVGESTLIFLMADGALWSWGIRMGSKPHHGVVEGIQRWFNKQDRRLFRATLSSMNLGMPNDRVPRKIWTLPAELERNLRDATTQRVGGSTSITNAFSPAP